MDKTDRDGKKAELAARIESGEVEVLDGPVPAVSRSAALPATEYGFDSLLQRASNLHRDIAAD